MENEFFVDSNGYYCFFCLDLINNSKDLRPELIIHSLQYFSHYLKLKRRKVFSNDDDTEIPPDLLKQVEKSVLKVQLCRECSLLNEECSKMLEKLEKIEMDLAFNIHAIQNKLSNSQSAKNCNLVGLMDIGKLEVFERLRSETIEKCNYKLRQNSNPKVQLTKLSDEEIKESTNRTKVPSFLSNFEHDNLEYCNLTTFQTNSELLNDVKQENVMDSNDLIHENENNDDDNYPDSFSGSEDEEVERKARLKVFPKTDKTLKRDKNSSSIPPAIKIYGKTDSSQSKCEFNQDTKMYKCRLCTLQFNCSATCRNHYNKVHLNLRYKCSICELDFVLANGYRQHFRTVHLQTKFGCNLRHKSFNQKSHLRRHQKTVHYGFKYGCKFCHQKFSYSPDMNKHVKNIHKFQGGN